MDAKSKPAHTYYAPHGGDPDPEQLVTDRAIFTEAYVMIPRRVLRDITASYFPHWKLTKGWVLARPLSGFAETFAEIAMVVEPGGGSDRPEEDPEAESVIFLMEGEATVTIAGTAHRLTPGGYAFLAPGEAWAFDNSGSDAARFIWVRKRYQPVDGIDRPESFVTNENDVGPQVMPLSDGRWKTTRFVDPADMRHDMHVNIVTFEAGGVIPFAETHVMEHGLYVLEGRAVYRLNEDWVEVQEGDFLWLRAFCPQACYEGGPEPFRYLLYKDVNRHMPLAPPGK